MNMVNIAQDKFRHCMNPPEDGFDGIAAVEKFSEKSRRAGCSWVGEESVENFSGDRNFYDAVTSQQM